VSDILEECSRSVLHLAFNRPQKKNAITTAMYTQLASAMRRADDDAQVRAIVLRGTAGCFTAGNDLHDFVHDPPASADAPVVQFLRTLAELEKPLLAAVEGPAIGIGTTLLLHCDLVYAAPTARFQLPFVRLGLTPEAASTYLLPRLCGHQRAAELLLLAEPFDAARALALGLVNEVVDQAVLNERVRDRALQLADLPPAAVVASKKLLKRGTRAAVTDAIIGEATMFVERLRDASTQATMKAFLAQSSASRSDR
jgi:enoyl-CoA hydratase/carnithine racemase